MTNKVFIDYAQFGDKIVKLYKKIKKGMDTPNLIIGIANGGLNISKPLANWFQCKHIGISIHFYDDEYKLARKPFYADIPHIPVDIKNVLLVDDILDTGTTIKYFMDQTKLVQDVNFKIATLHWNPDCQSGLKPNYFVDTKHTDNWIVYPWESETVENL